MGDSPIDHRLPGSFIVNTLRSPEFQDAIDAATEEARRTGVLQKAIDRFGERADQNGLAVNALFADILELARVIINWYFEQDRKNKPTA
jgi:hypothetical protein